MASDKTIFGEYNWFAFLLLPIIGIISSALIIPSVSSASRTIDLWHEREEHIFNQDESAGIKDTFYPRFLVAVGCGAAVPESSQRPRAAGFCLNSYSASLFSQGRRTQGSSQGWPPFQSPCTVTGAPAIAVLPASRSLSLFAPPRKKGYSYD